jgi:exocyst complex component 2
MESTRRYVEALTSSNLEEVSNVYQILLPSSSFRRSPSQCQTMAVGIVKLYVSLISQLFLLSDMVIMTSPSAAANLSRPPLLPVNSLSLSTAYYLQKILAEAQDCVADIISLDISSDASQDAKNLMDRLRWRFEGIFTSDWLRGMWTACRVFNHFTNSRSDF